MLARTPSSEPSSPASSLSDYDDFVDAVEVPPGDEEAGSAQQAEREEGHRGEVEQQQEEEEQGEWRLRVSDRTKQQSSAARGGLGAQVVAGLAKVLRMEETAVVAGAGHALHVLSVTALVLLTKSLTGRGSGSGSGGAATTAGPAYPVFLLSALHFAVAGAGCRLLRAMRVFTYWKPPPPSTGLFSFSVLYPIAFGAVVSVAFMNLSLAHNSVPTFLLSKIACTPVQLAVHHCLAFRARGGGSGAGGGSGGGEDEHPRRVEGEGGEGLAYDGHLANSIARSPGGAFAAAGPGVGVSGSAGDVGVGGAYDGSAAGAAHTGSVLYPLLNMPDNVRYALVPLCVGIILGMLADPSLTFGGFLFAVLAVAASTSATVFTSKPQRQVACNPLQLLDHTAPLIAGSLLAMSLFFEDIRLLITYPYTQGVFWQILLSCLCALGVNVSTFMVAGRSSSALLQGVRHLQTFTILVLGHFIFHYDLTRYNIAGISLALFGVVSYTEALRKHAITQLLPR